MSEDKDLDFERKHQEDLQRLRGFRLLDDDFMTKVFEDEDYDKIAAFTELTVKEVHELDDKRSA